MNMGGFRVAPAFNSSLPGWLVIVANRHVESIEELTSSEAGALGHLIRVVSLALKDVLACSKTYVMLFAEAPGFRHLHVHLVPRAHDMPNDLRGPAIFHYLRQPESDWVSATQRDRLAGELHAA